MALNLFPITVFCLRIVEDSTLLSQHHCHYRIFGLVNP